MLRIKIAWLQSTQAVDCTFIRKAHKYLQHLSHSPFPRGHYFMQGQSPLFILVPAKNLEHGDLHVVMDRRSTEDGWTGTWKCGYITAQHLYIVPSASIFKMYICWQESLHAGEVVYSETHLHALAAFGNCTLWTFLRAPAAVPSNFVVQNTNFCLKRQTKIAMEEEDAF